MSETLKYLLTMWNKGVYRGARRNFAKAVGVNEGTISNWFLGRGTPSEQAVVKMSSVLRRTPDQIRWFFPKITDTGEHYEGFKRRGLVEVEATSVDSGESIHLNVSKELAEKFKATCKFERRDANSQMEVILEDWFAQREKPPAGLWEAEIGGVGGPTTKTRRSRVIPLHPRAREAMGSPRTHGLVFDLPASSIVHALSDAAKKVKLGRVRFHDFRHTWATRYMQATGDLFGLMRLGGWSSMGSVRVYQHLTKARSDSVILVSYPPISPLKSGAVDGKSHA